MKCETREEVLQKAVSLAEKVTEKNPTLPVLKCILLSLKEGVLTLRATNLDLAIEISIPVRGEGEGVLAVPGSIFAQTLSALEGVDKVILEEVNGNLALTSKYGKTLLKTEPHDDFPHIPHGEGGGGEKVRSQDFIQGIKSVWYSASTSTIKPELSSVYVRSHDKKLVFAATDSFRLAEKIVSTTKWPDFEGILIPFRNIPEILRVLESGEGDLEVEFEENKISFSFDRVYLTSRLVNGNFPDYEQIVPKDFTTEAKILKHDLLQALKKAVIFSDLSHQVTFEINPTAKKFTLRAEHAPVGETHDEIPASLEGEPLTISFNHKYILDAFQALPGESLTLYFNGGHKPLVMKGTGDDSFKYLLMPMNR